ncbi:MAG TPA: WD40 repeat domain-containing protein, partial [Acidimicrobiales bacterium]
GEVAVADLEGYQPGVAPPTINSDGSLFASVDRSQVLRMWDTATGDLVATRPGVLNVLAIDRAGDRVVLATGSGAGVWHVDPDVVEPLDPEISTDLFLVARFDPEGELFTAGSGGLRRVELDAADRLRRDAGGGGEGDDGPPSEWSLEYDDGTVRVMKGSQLSAEWSITDALPNTSPTAMAVTPDGATVLIAHGEGLTAFEARSGTPLGDLTTGTGIDGQAIAVAVSPDSRVAASVAMTGQIRFFDLATLRPLGRPVGVGVRSLVPTGELPYRTTDVELWFSPDGTELTVAPREGSANSTGAVIWKAPASWPELACTMAGRALTADERAVHATAPPGACPS